MTDPLSQDIKVFDSDDIDLKELFNALWAGMLPILVTTFFFCVSAIVYALNLPNVYQSEVTLAPASENIGLNLPSQLGGLAALAGVSLSGKGADKTALALEVLKSRDFLGQFIEAHDLFIPIMAAEGWDRSKDRLVIDKEIYNENTNQWVREVEAPFQSKPSLLETIEDFEKLIQISQDKTTGIVNLSIEHYSPFMAKKIADDLVIAINENMRRRDLQEAEKSISYLNEQIKKTNIADVRTMLYSLIEEQTKTVMLANVRNEYILKTIDPAVVSEKKSAPSRALICLIITLSGLLLSSLIVLILHYTRK